MKNHHAKYPNVALIAALIAVLTFSVFPAQIVSADETIPVSDLVLSLVSAPKHVKGCETFEVFFQVTNLGPDPAYNLSYAFVLSDEYDPVGIQRGPQALGVGETATFSAVIKATGYVAKKTFPSWVGVGVRWDFSDSGFDPNLANNEATTLVKLISNPVMNCWE